ncbi:uncharacterized protein LOC111711669 [Eurytemora carolleeae]|uniref:uncharacterized protein LOC111711669 n=1 Tax=Eurytemora carolleeae TaxID=1294199 RepID=UPI000C76DCE6|nr:uncharacterized protein LOC111711669 [Eurytemora carolleeae]|eukprot:XP_023341833.1 uncharacterized protein LOC111711669 [Eurytemora affinis]
MPRHIVIFILSVTVFTTVQSQLENYVIVRSQSLCIPPYQKVGKQCLFFSRPHSPWGLSDTWHQAYKSVYDAAVFCMAHDGQLAEQVQDFKSALDLCATVRGGCAPSLVARRGHCFQWNPLDGSEIEIPCNHPDLKARFICQQN